MIDLFEIESVAIAQLMNEPDLLDETILRPKHFGNTQLKQILKIVIETKSSGLEIDLQSITAKADELGMMDNIGGFGFLSDVYMSFVTSANFSFYEKKVLENWKVRESIRITQLLANSMQENYSLEKFRKANDLLTEIESEGINSEYDLKKSLSTLYINLTESTGQMNGIDTGFEELNRITGGLQTNDLIIVAARPSVGKTAFCLNVGKNAAKCNAATKIFSLEMAEQDLLKRLVSIEGHIQGEKHRNPQTTYSMEDWNKLSNAIGSLEDLPLEINDKSTITVSEMWADVRKFKRKHPDRRVLVVIDYLQLIQGEDKRQKRYDQISEISRMLKQMAKELKVCVIALSQLSRAVEQRQDKRPMLSDLRESGQIEQDADLITFLYRDDYYDKKTENKNIIEIIIAKHRNGSVGTVNLGFVKEYGKFINLDKQHELNLL